LKPAKASVDDAKIVPDAEPEAEESDVPEDTSADTPDDSDVAAELDEGATDRPDAAPVKTRPRGGFN